MQRLDGGRLEIPGEFERPEFLAPRAPPIGRMSRPMGVTLVERASNCYPQQ